MWYCAAQRAVLSIGKATQQEKLYGSLAKIDGPVLISLPDLKENLDAADASYVGIRSLIDAWIARKGIDAPEVPPFVKDWEPQVERTELSAKAAGISAVLWAIRFRPKYRWIEVDFFDTHDRSAYHRCVTTVPGFHFIGLGWLNTWGYAA